MEKQKITGSEALLKSLIAEGVDTISVIPAGKRFLFTIVCTITGIN